MRYPLTERIGNPDLLVGRERDFRLLNNWLEKIPKRLSKSRVILARRKSGKTAVVQRIFNRLWTENGTIIPFYYSFPEVKKWLPEFALEYYCAFASQYISFVERDESFVKQPLPLEKIREYGLAKPVKLLADDADVLSNYKNQGMHSLMWKTAYTAPERFAGIYDQRILVILDEFQNITQYIYPDQHHQTAPDETLAGSFHDCVESKIAPMLVTGSYVGWLISVIDKYLEAGRLKRHFMHPYLTPEEGLEAVYKYAEAMDVPVTNETAEQINCLCMSDPFFISCVIQSEYEEKDLSTQEGVVSTVNYEITDPSSEMSMTWGEYIELTLKKVNDRHAKQLLLHLSKHADREWTPKELKNELGLDIEENAIREKLEMMVKADVLKKGGSDIDYSGLQDGTIYLILRHRFEKEITSFAPDLKEGFSKELENLKTERNSLQGRLNALMGRYAEYQLFLEFRSRVRFSLDRYFSGISDTAELNIRNVVQRYKFQRSDGKEMEIDVMAESSCGRTVLAEVKKAQKKMGLPEVRGFHEKVMEFEKQFPDKTVLPAYLSVGGFSGKALAFCRQNGIGTAERIAFFK